MHLASVAAERGVDVHLQPSPPWGRGWLATGAFISRGETGEGVARTPVLGVRGSSLARTAILTDRRKHAGSGARVEGRTADLRGGGLRYTRLCGTAAAHRIQINEVQLP
jgi:hypothetical protein